MYLILAAVWCAGAFALFVYEWRTGDLRWRFLGGHVSSAWIMLLFAVYNLARWYAARAERADRAALNAAHEARMREVRHHEMPAEPDPTFDFTDRKDKE